MDFDRKSRYMNQTSSNSSSYIDLGLDMHSLDLLCKMAVSKNKMVRRAQLMNISKLLNIIDPMRYSNDPAKAEKIRFINKAIEARLGLNLEDPYMIMKYVDGGVINDNIIDLDHYEDLDNSEVQFMNDMVSETLQYATIYQTVDRMMDVCSRFKTQDYGSKGDIVEEFKTVINDTQNEFRRTRNEDHTEMMFSLQEGAFEDCVIETYNRAANPKKKLSTGMQAMNESLGGGFESGRTYIYFGLPGEGKSSVILNLIYQIKKYNRDYQCKDPTKRPCIVLLTMENSVEESIERIFGIASNRESMTEFDVNSVINMLRTDGELSLSDDNPIDIIIKYKPTNSVDTGYMYTLSDDLEDQGYEVICFFQDYIGRIRSTQHLTDIRLEYGAVIDDFKTYAHIKDIPVVSVSQLNRDASKRIDEGRQTSKNDLVRALGRSNISESMLVLNNIDAGFMIAPEYTSDGKKYMGVQRVKIRYNAGNLECFYLPFSEHSGIKLLEDVGREALYKNSLRSAPAGIQMSADFRNEVQDLDRIQTESINKSIFSTEVNGSSMNITDLDNTFTNSYFGNSINIEQQSIEYAKPKVLYKKLIDPMIFDTCAS